MSAYADYSDMIVYYDASTVGDLLGDDGTPSESPESDPKLSGMLESASGQVEAACCVSGIYTPTQLAALTGNALALLKQLVCTLAMVSLARRRPEKFGSEYWQAVRKESEDYLDRLRKGDRLFDSEAKRAAGLPTIDGPTALDYQRLNLLPSRTRNYFPHVSRRIPLGRG